MGRLKEATKTYELALKFNPSNVRYWCNLAKVCNENNKFQKAEKAATEALRIDPINIEGLNNMGLALENQSNHKRALKYYKSALKIDPNNSVINCNIGKLYFNINEIEKAIKCLKKSISLNPNVVEPYYNLCEIYDKTNKLNQFAEALSSVPIGIKKDPSIQLKKGQLKFRNKEYNQCIDLLNQINRRKLSTTKLSILFELLGKSYDSVKNFNTAYLNFSHMNENSSNIANNIGINADTYNKNIVDLIQNFVKAPYNHEKKLRTKDMDSPIFIIGFPRSGTTLLDTILRSHPNIAVIEEKPLIDKIISIIDQPLSSETLSELSSKKLIELRKLYEEESKLLVQPIQNNQITIDKFPLNIIHVPVINALFPNCKYILVLRHPCDCVLSCFMQNFELNEAMANFLNIKDTVTLYCNVMKLWSIYSEKFVLNVQIVKYENLISNFEQTSKNLLNFLGLDWNDKLLKFYETGRARKKIMTPSYHQVTEKIYTHATERWKNYSKNLETDLTALKPWIKYFSYED